MLLIVYIIFDGEDADCDVSISFVPAFLKPDKCSLYIML